MLQREQTVLYIIALYISFSSMRHTVITVEQHLYDLSDVMSQKSSKLIEILLLYFYE